LTQLGVDCAVIAPSLAPVRAGDRVKTDRRDAERLARSHRNGDLTAVWVPDAEAEALRDLVRAREAAKQDQTRARHRLSKLLLRQGLRPAVGVRAWTGAYMAWLRQLRFAQPALEMVRLDYLHEIEHMAERVLRLEETIREAIAHAPAHQQAIVQGLQALRGIALISAVTIASELGSVARFDSARQLMGYSGLTPSENTSGPRTRRGAITRSGNAHLRRIVGEAAWSYRRMPAIGPALRKRQQGLPAPILDIAWKAQLRLSKRFARLIAAGKESNKAASAVARELLGFIWAIGTRMEQAISQPQAA